jgi:hypothetical protein
MKNGIIDEKGPDLSEENASSRADQVSREEEEEAIGIDETGEQHKDNTLSRTQSRKSAKSEIDPFGEPPDGGLNAWLKVVGCFLIYSNIWCVCHLGLSE